jgi:hypothetical protein
MYLRPVWNGSQNVGIEKCKDSDGSEFLWEPKPHEKFIVLFRKKKQLNEDIRR